MGIKTVLPELQKEIVVALLFLLSTTQPGWITGHVSCDMVYPTRGM